MSVYVDRPMARRFVAYFYCNGADLSLGVSVNFERPNIEIHVPFVFFRIGWQYEYEIGEDVGERLGNKVLYRAFGYR